MYTFEEKFTCWDNDYKPYGIRIESCSNLWHKHARAAENGYTVYCTGNKYLLNMPETRDFSLNLNYLFEVLNRYAGISAFFGYNEGLHSGYELRAEWKKQDNTALFTLFKIKDERYTKINSVALENVEFPQAKTEYSFSLSMKNNLLTAVSGDASVTFELSSEKGSIGFSRPNFVGSVRFCSVFAECDEVKTEDIKNINVTIPTVNGGTMPLEVEYKLFTANGKPYVTATLDGGPQYRDQKNYCPYPVNREGQYVVERWFMQKPYVKLQNKNYYFSMCEVRLADPHLAWKTLLYPLLNFVDLPVSITVPIDSQDINEVSFGYENLLVFGYRLQSGKNEFNFNKDGEYLGETVFPDTFYLTSPKDKKAVKLIPETAFDYEVVKSHFERNHYFAEDEEICFTVFSSTDKLYITYEAELQDVFGDCIEKLEVINGTIKHSPLKVGVYRIHLTVKYGDKPLKEIDTAFEVFDGTGKRCAPLESGLPVLFSMPNEQQYLDRDPFDPWNIGKPANLEHFYSCTAFTGHVAEYKRSWEITKLFGRSWYVWLSNHRTMIDHDLDKHIDILKNGDYIYYPSDYEWGVLRSDTFKDVYWEFMPKVIELLNEFLDSKEGAREKVGYTRGEAVTEEHITKLHKFYMNDWYTLLRNRLTQAFEEQNKALKKINPNFKRACYGPFNVYASNLRTSKLAEFSGFETDETLSDVIYTGFAQFEDYPFSCAYQTYRGALGAGTTLVKAPDLVIYPEQYKSSPGGCIDGAVYFAHPPIGAYTMPDWFNTTLSREYVYNTARKTEDGFGYWNTYGFMKADLTDREIDPFIRDWKYVLRHKPERPLRSAVYICEFDSSDDGFEDDYPGWRIPYNISEEGIGYLYETSRLAGLPSGFFASWKTFLTLTAKDTDLIILPSTVSAPKEALDHVRALYNEGVSIIAVSRVDGLEDLFGVKYAPRQVRYYSVDTENETENVYPYTAIAGYEADTATASLYAEGTPVIFENGRTALYNISPAAIGRFYFFCKPENSRTSLSALLRKNSTAVMRNLSCPNAITDDANCGLTLFEDTNKNTMLLAIDYSNHDQAKQDIATEKTIMFKGCDYTNAVAVDGREIRCLRNENGILDGIAVALHPHESALIRLF